MQIIIEKNNLGNKYSPEKSLNYPLVNGMKRICKSRIYKGVFRFP